jgi:hypothetical protein
MVSRGPRSPIWDENGREQIGYVQANEAFDRDGNKLYDVDGLNLLDPQSRKVMGHLQSGGALLPGDRSAAHLFPKRKRP